MRFTSEQLHAIERRTGELLLDAGAGSGKTSVLVERFARAIEEDGIGVHEILTITFTEKAAAELRERIRARLRAAGDIEAARASETAWISTIHAFCARLLRSHALDAGLDPEFTVMDDNDAAELRRGAFDQALSACARTAAGSELIAAYGPAQLRATTLHSHDELRARGEISPSLPWVPEPPPAEDIRAACRLAEQLASAVQRELGQVKDPGRRISEALAQMELVPAVLASDALWPGELAPIRLGTGALALRTQVCDHYRAALDELAEMAASVHAVSVRAALDALLREYGRRYAALKHEHSVLDFSDLELLARELLRNREIGNRYRERFTRVMVDEMQDTNGVQLELIDLVAGIDLFMVGDAQQSIYGFRHADVELFEERGARLEGIGGRASLQTNFRSHPAILDALNGAFADDGALGESFRPLEPGREIEQVPGQNHTPRVELLIVDKDAIAASHDPIFEQPAAPWRVAEARTLAARLRELIDAGEARAADIVVLLRATTDIHVYEAAIEATGVPTYVVGGRGYWSHREVIELVAYLRVLANPLDTEALYTVLSSSLGGLSLDGLVLHGAGALDQLAEGDRQRLDAFELRLRGERRAAAWLGIEHLLERALAGTGYEFRMAELPDARRRLANVRKLMRLAREWQARHGNDLRSFVDMLQARAGSGDAGRESQAPVESEALDAVRLMTIHRSKGLEFPVVCVADLGRQVMPRPGAIVKLGRDGRRLGLRLRRPGAGERIDALAYDAVKLDEREFEAAEERRLFYVAMTRARERLIISGAAKLEAWAECNRLAPVGWIGAALVPDMEARAAEAAVADDVPAPFVGELGVRTTFVTVAPGESVGGGRLTGAKRRQSDPPAMPQIEPDMRPALTSLSYSALASYEQCSYRFYVQNVLGLPETTAFHGPLPEPAPAPLGLPSRTVAPRSSLSASERGTLIHELLASLDLRQPSLNEPMPPDVRALLAGLLGSTTSTRLAALRDVRREQRFAFPHGELLITGVFDLLARERPDELLVVDYKSDRLAGSDPRSIVTDRYGVQRTIYALAALKLGAAAVEIMHLFLEAPEDPVTATFTAADGPALELDLSERVARVIAGDGVYPVTDNPGRRVCEGCPAQDGLCSYPLEITCR